MRVYLVIENRLTREALARLFQKQSNMSVVGQSPSHETSRRHRHIVNSGCAILIVDFLETVSLLDLEDDARDHSKFKIILFGMEEEPESFLHAVSLGICGYLLKDASSAEIVSAVRGVARGEAVCSNRLCMVLFERVCQDHRQRSGLADDEAGLKLGLTFRQRQLVSLIAKGMSNKEIASNLNLSECTVKNHVYRIMKHVEAESRQDAVDLIRWRGYLSAD